MPLTFLPGPGALFAWGEDAGAPPLGAVAGEPARVELSLPRGRRAIDGRVLPLLEATARLAVVPVAALGAAPASIAAWALAGRLALALVARERVVPKLDRRGGGTEARWAVALSAAGDAAEVDALARSMPPSAHAVPANGGPDVWSPDALLRAYLDAVADRLVREAAPSLAGAGSRPRWEERWRAALASPDAVLRAGGFAERTLEDDLAAWSEPALGARDRLRAFFRLELPGGEREPFRLRFLLQSPDDPSLLVPAADVWRTRGRSLERLGRAFRDPQESLLEALGRAARLFAPIEHALAAAAPESIDLDAGAAWAFLSEGAPLLAEAGFAVAVPGELTAAGRRRLRLRMRVGTSRGTAGVVPGAGIDLGSLVAFEWRAAIGDEPLDAAELAELARTKAPLVRHRGAWVAVDPAELAEIRRRLADGPGTLGAREALRVALAGETRAGSLPVAVEAEGTVLRLLD